MNYDKDSITAYLLGNATEQDTERFDELSIADDEFADALSAAEDNLVDAYIDGELTGASLRQFEERYLASPLRRRKVLFAEAFRLFSNRHTVEQPAAGETPQRAPNPRVFSKLRFVPVWQWSIAAAALVFASLAGWLAIQNSELHRQADEKATIRNAAGLQEQRTVTRPTSETEDSAVRSEVLEVSPDDNVETVSEPETTRETDDRRIAVKPSPQRSQPIKAASPPIVAFLLTPQLRSAGNIPGFSIADGAGQAVFQIEMETTGYQSYSVELRDQSSGSVIWKTASIKPAAKRPNSIRISVPVRSLPPQIYTATVSGNDTAGSGEIIGDYTFRIVQ